MRTKINHIFLFALFALLSFSACQDEVTEVDNSADQETIVANSILLNLMSRTTANFGATDDILDGASCFSVELPVTIIVSDITIVIENESDLEQLEDLFEDLIDDEDFLNFVFPITIIFSDYTELVIENEDQLENFINECDVEDDDVIECIDFVYPISFSVFNSEFNLIDTVPIQNDETLYEFLEDLEDDDNALIVSLNYPVTLEYANGETIEVTNNQELADAIEAAGDDCDHEDDDCNQEEIALNLVECPWEVYLYTNDDLENLSGPYTFTFGEDGNMVIEGVGAETYTTTWELSQTDQGLELNIASFYYYEAQFGNWLVVECDDDDDLEFEHLTVDGTGLFFEQECEDDLDCSLTDLGSILQECPWDFTDGTDSYNNYQLVFNSNGDLQITEGAATSAIVGIWNLSLSDQGLPEIVISNLTAFSDDLEGSWIIIECDDDGELTIIRGNSVLELEQDCDLVNDDEVFNCFNDFEIVECSQPNNIPVFNLSANTIGLVVCQFPFTASFHATELDAENNTNAIENTEAYGTLAAQVYLRIEAESGNFQVFDVYLNTEECNDFDCFVNTEITACSENNEGIATFNLTEANQECGPDIAIYGIYYFESESDAQNVINPIANPESYTNSAIQNTIFGAVINVNGNVVEHIFTITLIPENCNLFECFQSFDAVIEQCDNGTDGPYIFDLTIAFANCTPSADVVTYHETQADAETGFNAITNPEAYTNVAVQQSIYVRVEIGDQLEVFPILLIIVDCNQDPCSEADVDSFLVECIWNAVNYNGSDNLLEYNFDFESNSQEVVIYTNDIIIDATWSTSQSDDGVIIDFSNVAGPNIQAIAGEWLVVECEENRLELLRGDDLLVLERDCD